MLKWTSYEALFRVPQKNGSLDFWLAGELEEYLSNITQNFCEIYRKRDDNNT